MTTRKLTMTALAAGFAVTLAACGAGTASHVVKGATPPSKAAASTTAVSPTATGGPGSPTTTPSNGLTQHTLDQVAAELGSLDTSLNAANSDLNNPQGDS